MPPPVAVPQHGRGQQQDLQQDSFTMGGGHIMLPMPPDAPLPPPPSPPPGEIQAGATGVMRNDPSDPLGQALDQTKGAISASTKALEAWTEAAKGGSKELAALLLKSGPEGFKATFLTVISDLLAAHGSLHAKLTPVVEKVEASAGSTTGGAVPSGAASRVLSGVASVKRRRLVSGAASGAGCRGSLVPCPLRSFLTCRTLSCPQTLPPEPLPEGLTPKEMARKKFREVLSHCCATILYTPKGREQLAEVEGYQELRKRLIRACRDEGIKIEELKDKVG